MKRILSAAAILTGMVSCGTAGDFTEDEVNLINDGGEDVMTVVKNDSYEDSLFLREVSKPLSDRALRSDEYALLCRRMLLTVKAPENDGVGIAGPQVGISRRVVAVQRFDKEGEPFEVYANPEIIRYGSETAPGGEGCLSVPNLRGVVERSQEIDLKYRNLRGTDTVETVKGFTAVIFQHEIDHLDGILYTDRASTLENEELTLVVGTYTGSGSDGIYVYRFNQEEGRFVSDEAVGFTEIENPSFLTVSDDDMVYAVSEMPDSRASLTSYRFNPDTFAFERAGIVSSEGADPCYVSTDGEIVAVGNYSGGTMSLFEIGEDGSAAAAYKVIKGSATGPDKSRQASPHIHCVVFTPDGKSLIATDFSGDRLIRYRIADGSMDYCRLGDDTGPRHVVFSPDGRFLYVIGELSGEVTAVEYGHEMKIKQVIRADRTDARGAADIHVSPDGRHLYASLRLQNDGIAVFKINDDGTLTEAGYVNTGIHPRNFTITPNGRFLLCACRDSDSVEVYSIDKETGLPERTGESLSLSKPVCLVFD